MALETKAPAMAWLRFDTEVGLQIPTEHFWKNGASTDPYDPYDKNPFYFSSLGIESEFILPREGEWVVRFTNCLNYSTTPVRGILYGPCLDGINAKPAHRTSLTDEAVQLGKEWRSWRTANPAAKPENFPKYERLLAFLIPSSRYFRARRDGFVNLLMCNKRSPENSAKIEMLSNVIKSREPELEANLYTLQDLVRQDLGPLLYPECQRQSYNKNMLCFDRQLSLADFGVESAEPAYFVFMNGATLKPEYQNPEFRSGRCLFRSGLVVDRIDYEKLVKNIIKKPEDIVGILHPHYEPMIQKLDKNSWEYTYFDPKKLRSPVFNDLYELTFEGLIKKATIEDKAREGS